MPRKVLREVKERLREKFGKKPKFKDERVGKVIYKNPDAKKGTPPYTMENVEWLSIVESNMIGWGGFGEVFWGKIKFKGEPSSKRVVLKRYKRALAYLDFGYGFQSHLFSTRLGKPSDKADLGHVKEVIRRLNASDVSHPKMEYMRINGDDYIVMEPFVEESTEPYLMTKPLAPSDVERLAKQKKSIWSRIVTKFKSYGDLVYSLDLDSEINKDLFMKVVRETAKLAKAKLAFGKTEGFFCFRIDLFNYIWVRDKNGKKIEDKVIVQDIDSLYACDDVHKAWSTSVKNLVDVVSQENVRESYSPAPEFKEIALEIINKVAKEEGLPEIK